MIGVAIQYDFSQSITDRETNPGKELKHSPCRWFRRRTTVLQGKGFLVLHEGLPDAGLPRRMRWARNVQNDSWFLVAVDEVCYLLRFSLSHNFSLDIHL